MTKARLIVLSLSAAFLAVLVFAQSNPPASATSGRKAVVVELFTSEGCSSCPPADALLAQLGQEHRTDGLEVIPLGLHVDYWNFQGWTDRFSSSAYTQRQFKYAQRLHVANPYTPQLVFDGAVESEGADSPRAHHLIDKAAQKPALAEVRMAASGEDRLEIAVKGPSGLKGEVMLACTEDNLSSNVGSGENHGRELRHAAVVRELRSLGTLRGGNFSTTAQLKLKKDWKRSDLRAVVFVQEPDSGAIDGAASLRLGEQLKLPR